jgi:putative transcriptional regulator
MLLRVRGAGLVLLVTAVSAAQTLPRRVNPVQDARAEDLAIGKLLVAQKELGDPNFAESVVLITEYGEEGTSGLIINRRSKVALSKFYPEIKGKNAADPVYSGGPVEEKLGFGLLRSRDRLEDTKRILPDVRLITDDKMLDKMVASGKDASTLRMYVGYCGWGPEQLEHEMELGAWHLFPGTAELVFDPDPDSLWSRLIRKTQLRIALRRRYFSTTAFPPFITQRTF